MIGSLKRIFAWFVVALIANLAWHAFQNATRDPGPPPHVGVPKYLTFEVKAVQPFWPAFDLMWEGPDDGTVCILLRDPNRKPGDHPPLIPCFGVFINNAEIFAAGSVPRIGLFQPYPDSSLMTVNPRAPSAHR